MATEDEEEYTGLVSGLADIEQPAEVPPAHEPAESVEASETPPAADENGPPAAVVSAAARSASSALSRFFVRYRAPFLSARFT